MSPPNPDTYRNRLRRLRVLQTLYNQRPEYVGEGILLQCLREDADLSPTPDGIRRSLDYLAQRGLVVIEKKQTRWLSKITADGVDYLEGDDPGIDGISHPQEFMS